MPLFTSFSYINIYTFLINIGVQESHSNWEKENIQRTNKALFFILFATILFQLYCYCKGNTAAFSLPIYLTYVYHLITLFLNALKKVKTAFIFYLTASLLVLFFIVGYWGRTCMVQMFMIGVCLQGLLYYKDNRSIAAIVVLFTILLYSMATLMDMNTLFRALHLPQNLLEEVAVSEIRTYALIAAFLFVINTSYTFINKIQAQNEELNEQILLQQNINASLEESRIMQKMIFDNSYNGQSLFVMKENTFTLIDCNEQTLKLFECPDKATYLRDFMQYHCDDRADERRREMLQVLANLGTYTDELIFKTYFGRKFYARRWVKKVILGPQVYILGSIEDISIAKEAANKIIESKARLLSVFNSTTDRVWSVNLDLQLQYFNIPFEKAYKEYWQKEPIMGMEVKDIFQNLHICLNTGKPIDWEYVFKKVLTEGERITFDVYVVYPNKKIYLSHTLNPIIANEGNETIGCTAWSKDITDITLKRLEIEEKKQLIEMILGTIPDMLYIYDLQENKGVYSNVNQSKYLGYDAELQEPNFIIDKMIYPEDRDKIIKHWDKIREMKNDEVVSIEHRAYHKDGTVKWFLSREKVFLRNEDGSVKQYIGLTQDVSEIKKTEEILKIQNANLIKLNKELDGFVYSTAHDLRAPISTVLGLIDIIERENIASGINIYVSLLKKSIDRLDLFISDLILYAHNSRQEISFDAIDFSYVLHTALSELTLVSYADKVHKIIEVDTCRDFISDPYRLKIILRHIIANAMQYADLKKSEPFVKITITVNLHHAIISIQDNGIGMKPSTVEQIFEMFYKGTVHSKGSGLGMYIVKDTVQKIGGSIEVSSELHIGTEVKIVIPNLQSRQAFK